LNVTFDGMTFDQTTFDQMRHLIKQHLIECGIWSNDPFVQMQNALATLHPHKYDVWESRSLAFGWSTSTLTKGWRAAALKTSNLWESIVARTWYMACSSSQDLGQ